ncbi:MAG: NAD(P)-binding protein [Gemmatimonadaceae bacterium]|nr:NAD(P)-binding protein [Gemmatimonadaceae bacterium]
MLRDAHALRDGAFTTAERCATDAGEGYGLVIIGGGAAGLGAAYEARRQRLRRVYVFEEHAVFGGECKRDEVIVDGVRLVSPHDSSQFGMPSATLGQLGTQYPALRRDYGLPAQMDEFPWEPWAIGIEPLEIPRDNFYYQLWDDESDAHAHAFTDARGAVRLVRNLFGRALDDAR